MQRNGREAHRTRLVLAIAATLLPLVLLGLALPQHARADDFEDFENARQAYASGDYASAVARFERLVGGEVPTLTDQVYILESRKYLGAAYLFVGRPGPAERQFELLVREEPRYTLDADSFSREVVTLFGSVRSRVEEELRREEEARRLEEQQRRQQEIAELMRDRDRLVRLEELARTETVEQQNRRSIALIPYGVGQFQNGSDALGYLFAVTEGLLTVGSIGTAVWWMSLNKADDTDPIALRDAEESLRITNQVLFFSLVGVAIIGVVEAQLNFAQARATTRLRELPPELEHGAEDDVEPDASPAASTSTGLDLSVSPFGLTLRF